MSGNPHKQREAAREVTHLFSGFGPRNVMMLKYILVTLLAEKAGKLDMIAAVGKKTTYRLVVFESQDKGVSTGGNAFQPDCDASLNNTISGRPQIANLDDIPADLKGRVEDIIDLQQRIARALESDVDDHVAFLEARNIGCASLFKNAMLNGKLDTTPAFTARGVIGRIQNDTLEEAIELAKEKLPDVKIEIHYRHEVVGQHLERGTKSSLKVRNLDNPAAPHETHYGDFLHLANGTTWRVPFKGELAAASYSGVPGHFALEDYFETRGVLSPAPSKVPGSFPAKRVLEPGTRTGVSGMGLSSFDMGALTLVYTTALQVDNQDPRRWRFDPIEAKKYPGVLQFFSRSDGSVPPPRYVYTQDWHGERPSLTTRQFHAVFLQREFNWLEFARLFLYANVARTLRKHPSEVNVKRSTKDQFAYYRQQTELYYAANTKEERGRLEAALLRSGYQAFANGAGFESDPEAAEAKLVSEAPHSRMGIAGWPVQRALLHAVTRPHIARLGSNAEFVKMWQELQLYLTSSPVEIHDLFAQAFENGMAEHTVAAYDDVAEELVDGKIDLKGTKLDAMLASRVLTTATDKVFNSLAGAVKETTPGQPEYAKGRVLQTPEGDLLQAFDNGSGGYGKAVMDAEGKRSLVGAQWHDTNAHVSANQQMPINALSAIIASTLIANGEQRPLDAMKAIYHGILPKEDDFKAETASFEKDWIEAHEQRHFLQLCEKLATSGDEYFKATDHVFTPEDRASFVANRSPRSRTEGLILEGYRARKIPAYNPKSLYEFEEQFVDYRPAQIEAIWKVVVEKIVRG